MTPADTIEGGHAVLGIELGSTRIKACLIGEDSADVLGSGSFEWESELVDGLWTYSLDSVWTGLQQAFAELVSDVEARHGTVLTRLAAIGISAMMHGYLPFDVSGELLVPFRTWRNTTTNRAAEELSELFETNIPLRWSIAHLHQAVRDNENHISRLESINTLAGYVHQQLSGRRVLGIGDASGMFPVDSSTHDYDTELLARYDRLTHDSALAVPLRALLPEVLTAGAEAGRLTAKGAALLDPTGRLQPGALFCPPEGDAGTGMVATNSVAPRTGNVSAGTSIFAMVVLERALTRVHSELDLVATPVGDPVAMVHCNNGASELGEWAALFTHFSASAGSQFDADQVYATLLAEALRAEPDAGGLLVYNLLAGEPIVGLAEGRPLMVRTPDSRFTLANVMRAHLYGMFASLAIGVQVLEGEGVGIDRMHAHGGVFRTAGVAQRFLAAALRAPVAVVSTAGEGGAWGIALLAAFAVSDDDDLERFLGERVFASTTPEIVEPNDTDADGFATYLGRYRNGLAIERAAIAALP